MCHKQLAWLHILPFFFQCAVAAQGSACSDSLCALRWTYVKPGRYKQNRLQQHFSTMNLPTGAMALLEKMLTMDPSKRISAFDAFRVRLE